MKSKTIDISRLSPQLPEKEDTFTLRQLRRDSVERHKTMYEEPGLIKRTKPPKQETKQQSDERLQRLLNAPIATEEEIKMQDEIRRHLHLWNVREF